MLGADGPEVIEVNAIPGLTDTSLLPMASEAAGMSFEQFVERIVALALRGRRFLGERPLCSPRNRRRRSRRA